jgi:hypothetical protein
MGANVGGGQKFRNIMQTEPQPGTEGYVSTFVEMFSWVMTMPAYQALWELLFPFVNPYGWGYDFWYDKYAKARVPGHKMGIIGSVRVKHEQDFTAVGNGRTDNTRVEEKWQALVNQEIHYKAHFGVDLRKIREKLDLTNASWNGAVRGYLQTPTPSFYADHHRRVVIKNGHAAHNHDRADFEREFGGRSVSGDRRHDAGMPKAPQQGSKATQQGIVTKGSEEKKRKTRGFW